MHIAQVMHLMHPTPEQGAGPIACQSWGWLPASCGFRCQLVGAAYLCMPCVGRCAWLGFACRPWGGEWGRGRGRHVEEGEGEGEGEGVQVQVHVGCTPLVSFRTPHALPVESGRWRTPTRPYPSVPRSDVWCERPLCVPCAPAGARRAPRFDATCGATQRWPCATSRWACASSQWALGCTLVLPYSCSFCAAVSLLHPSLALLLLPLSSSVSTVALVLQLL